MDGSPEAAPPSSTSDAAVANAGAGIGLEGGLEHGLEDALQRFYQLIDDVLVTESTGRGHRDGQPEDVELGSMMEQALARARIDARARGIAFHARYDPTLLLHVCPGPAIAALRNVVENAVRFSTHGDVAVDVEDRGAEVAVHIRDTSNGTAAGINLIVAPRAQESLGWAISAECSLNVRCHVCLTLPASHL